MGARGGARWGRSLRSGEGGERQNLPMAKVLPGEFAQSDGVKRGNFVPSG